MNTQVYYHKVRRIYDHYLLEYMKLWATEKYRDFDDVLRFDDLKVLSEMMADAATNSPRAEIAKRILGRNHHKVVYHTGDSADALQLRKAKRILQSLGEQFSGIDFWLDDDAKGSIHKLMARGQQEESKVEDFFIVEKSGAITLITEDSAILEKIPREFRVVRIYADADSEVIDEIERVAHALRQER